MFRRKKEVVYSLMVSGISIEVSRKRIKNLYVRVNRNTGLVRVSCPYMISDHALEQFILSRLKWIENQITKANSRKQKTVLKYVSGEKIYFEGREYSLVLKEVKAKEKVEKIDNTIIMSIKNSSTIVKRQELLEAWYRYQLKERIPKLIEKYETKMGVRVKEFRIKKMKTRWGTCNIRVGRIWLSLELAKKSLGCLEMVVVHEMVHLLERLHNRRFYNFMEEFMPDWKIYNDELNSTID